MAWALCLDGLTPRCRLGRVWRKESAERHRDQCNANHREVEREFLESGPDAPPLLQRADCAFHHISHPVERFGDSGAAGAVIGALRQHRPDVSFAGDAPPRRETVILVSGEYLRRLPGLPAALAYVHVIEDRLDSIQVGCLTRRNRDAEHLIVVVARQVKLGAEASQRENAFEPSVRQDLAMEAFFPAGTLSTLPL